MIEYCIKIKTNAGRERKDLLFINGVESKEDETDAVKRSEYRTGFHHPIQLSNTKNLKEMEDYSPKKGKYKITTDIHCSLLKLVAEDCTASENYS